MVRPMNCEVGGHQRFGATARLGSNSRRIAQPADLEMLPGVSLQRLRATHTPITLPTQIICGRGDRRAGAGKQRQNKGHPSAPRLPDGHADSGSRADRELDHVAFEPKPGE